MTRRRRIISNCLVLVAIFTFAIIAYAQTATSNRSEIQQEPLGDRMIVAYLKETAQVFPDPDLMTHIFTSQSGINKTFDGLEIHDTIKLRKLTDLKEIAPDLKVVLSVGSYRPEGWSEMAASAKNRKKFAEDCAKVISQYNLDGIDMDWEFPTTTAGGLTASRSDTRNYVRLAKELRKTLGADKILTFYSNNSGKWIDFKRMLPYIDFVMVSGYNLGCPPTAHQSNLYSSRICGDWSVDKSIRHHMQLGVPGSKMLLGIPFYARFTEQNGLSYVERPNFNKYFSTDHELWDDQAKVPYTMDAQNRLEAAYDNERSVLEKCTYVKTNNLAGAFYWHYGSDTPDHSLARTISESLAK